MVKLEFFSSSFIVVSCSYFHHYPKALGLMIPSPNSTLFSVVPSHFSSPCNRLSSFHPAENRTSHAVLGAPKPRHPNCPIRRLSRSLEHPSALICHLTLFTGAPQSQAETGASDTSEFPREHHQGARHVSKRGQQRSQRGQRSPQRAGCHRAQGPSRPSDHSVAAWNRTIHSFL